MDFEIRGLEPTQAPELKAASAAGPAGDFRAALNQATDAAVRVDLDSSFPQTPPPEVTQAIDVASNAYDQLSATGQQLHFSVNTPTGGVAVELRDLDGNPLFTISASEALRIAGGESLN